MTVPLRAAILSSVKFSPALLFAAGEVGAWYDPSDLTTMFQDSAGSTPVTAVEQPVGLIRDKSGRANHASQATLGSRPMLSALYNKFTRSQQFDNAAWSWNAGVFIPTPNATTAPDGTNTAYKLVSTSGAAEHSLYQSPTSSTDRLSCYMKQAEWRYGFLRANFGGTYYNCFFDLQLGVVGTVDANWSNVTIRSVGNGWYQCSATIVRQAASAAAIGMSSSGTAINDTGDNTSGIYIWGADIRAANEGANLPPYQRVVTGTTNDYDTAGFPLYLKFDGTDDGLATASVNFSTTDKMTVIAGLRKLSDATQQYIAQFGGSLNGFLMQTFTDTKYYYGGGGSTFVQVPSNNTTAPSTNVLTGISNIATPEVTIRVNGAQQNTSSATQGTGAFGTNVLAIGYNGASNQFFNGRLYGLIVRGAATDPLNISKAEAWMNANTLAY